MNEFTMNHFQFLFNCLPTITYSLYHRHYEIIVRIFSVKYFVNRECWPSFGFENKIWIKS